MFLVDIRLYHEVRGRGLHAWAPTAKHKPLWMSLAKTPQATKQVYVKHKKLEPLQPPGPHMAVPEPTDELMQAALALHETVVDNQLLPIELQL